MSKIKYTKACPYCGECFDTQNQRKIYCSYAHASRYKVLKNKGHSEVFKLNEFERNLWHQIHATQ